MARKRLHHILPILFGEPTLQRLQEKVQGHGYQRCFQSRPGPAQSFMLVHAPFWPPQHGTSVQNRFFTNHLSSTHVGARKTRKSWKRGKQPSKPSSRSRDCPFLSLGLTVLEIPMTATWLAGNPPLKIIIWKNPYWIGWKFSKLKLRSSQMSTFFWPESSNLFF